MFYSSYMPGGSYYPVPSLTVASFLHKTAGVAGFEPATNGLGLVRGLEPLTYQPDLIRN